MERNKPLLIKDQESAFNLIVNMTSSNEGGIFFLDAPGRAGKTIFTGNIALAVASSVIAATLIESGRTAHSAPKLPLNLLTTDTPICNMKKAIVLSMCKIVICNE